jgi:spermidine synthase
MRVLPGMAILSASTLLLQVALTRVFSISQFYHFAFLVVSLALLGFGASGSLLVLFPRLRNEKLSSWYALGFALSAVLAYLFVNHFAFDSYSIAWDSTQVLLLIANLLGLSIPFVFAGALIGAMLSQATGQAGRIYAANLLGSAIGAMFSPLAIGWLGSERVVLLCGVLGSAAAVVLSGVQRRFVTGLAGIGMVLCMALLVMNPSIFEIKPSPYKALSQYRLNPDAEISATYQNAYSRVDVVESSTIHSAQGLSLTYFGDLPPQVGLLIDGSNLQPVSNAAQIDEDLLQALPVAPAYSIQEQPDVLLLGSAGGMEALAALENGARHVTVVEPNDLIYEVFNHQLREWAGLATSERVTLVREEVRSFVGRVNERYDLVELPLVDNYRPITSGAFTLTEDYHLTVEAFQAYLSVLGDDGLFVTHRWLQTPPSECLRALAIIIEALDVPNPIEHIVAFRSFQHVTFIVKPTPFTSAEIDQLLAVVEELRYDLVLAPEMPEEMINQYARLETDVYHDTFSQLINSPDRAAFYADYDYEIAPPTDDKPFFFHFFRWEQTPAVIENLGRRWQPFGGSGYFVLLALLMFALVAALVFVIAPITLKKNFRAALTNSGLANAARNLSYFVLIGLAFLFVEVSLIQQYILLLGQPTLAIAAVIGALLLFSGLGSALSPRIPWRYAMLALVVLLLIYPLLVDAVTPVLLPLPIGLRLLVVSLLIAPVGFLMGIPFPRGISALHGSHDLVPWAWAANGSASVVSAVLGAALSLSLGFTPVLWIGSGLYLLATLTQSRG